MICQIFLVHLRFTQKLSRWYSLLEHSLSPAGIREVLGLLVDEFHGSGHSAC